MTSSAGRPVSFVENAVLALVLAAVALAGGAACARQGSPPGGPVDRIPPFVVLTEPDTFAFVEPFDGSVKVEFNERISERVTGGINRAVEVSPRSGEVRVSHKRRGLEIRMEGGFQEDRVYRITVLPAVVDMFGNQLTDPFEFFFSTGPDFNENAFAGVLTDRLTGQPVPEARVDAWQDGADSVIYTTVSDEDGIFALRTLPEGAYTLQAYLDVNRNFEANFVEMQALQPGESLGVADTSFVFLSLLQPDTTPSVLLGVTAVDSTTLELGFDDFMDPDSSLDGVSVTVARDTAEVAAGAPDQAPAVTLLLRPDAYEAFVQARMDSLAAVADSIAAAEAAAAAAADSTAPQPVPEPEPTLPADTAAGPEAPPPPVLPSQLFFALLDGPLEADALYTVTVTGVANIVGLPDGGGEVQFRGPVPPPPPEEDSLQADTLAVDSAGVDSTVAAPDTTAAPADTTIVPDTTTAPAATPAPDTTGAPPDTTTVPDTSGVSLTAAAQRGRRALRLGLLPRARRAPVAGLRRLRD